MVVVVAAGGIRFERVRTTIITTLCSAVVLEISRAAIKRITSSASCRSASDYPYLSVNERRGGVVTNAVWTRVGLTTPALTHIGPINYVYRALLAASQQELWVEPMLIGHDHDASRTKVNIFYIQISMVTRSKIIGYRQVMTKFYNRIAVVAPPRCIGVEVTIACYEINVAIATQTNPCRIAKLLPMIGLYWNQDWRRTHQSSPRQWHHRQTPIPGQGDHQHKNRMRYRRAHNATASPADSFAYY